MLITMRTTSVKHFWSLLLRLLATPDAVMEMSCRVFLAVVILAAFVTCGPSPRTRIPRCRDATHKYYDPVLKRCKHCPACEPGWGLTDLEVRV